MSTSPTRPLEETQSTAQTPPQGSHVHFIEGAVRRRRPSFSSLLHKELGLNSAIEEAHKTEGDWLRRVKNPLDNGDGEDRDDLQLAGYEAVCGVLGSPPKPSHFPQAFDAINEETAASDIEEHPSDQATKILRESSDESLRRSKQSFLNEA